MATKKLSSETGQDREHTRLPAIDPLVTAAVLAGNATREQLFMAGARAEWVATRRDDLLACLPEPIKSVIAHDPKKIVEGLLEKILVVQLTTVVDDNIQSGLSTGEQSTFILPLDTVLQLCTKTGKGDNRLTSDELTLLCALLPAELDETKFERLLRAFSTIGGYPSHPAVLIDKVTVSAEVISKAVTLAQEARFPHFISIFIVLCLQQYPKFMQIVDNNTRCLITKYCNLSFSECQQLFTDAELDTTDVIAALFSNTTLLPPPHQRVSWLKADAHGRGVAAALQQFTPGITTLSDGEIMELIKDSILSESGDTARKKVLEIPLLAWRQILGVPTIVDQIRQWRTAISDRALHNSVEPSGMTPEYIEVVQLLVDQGILGSGQALKRIFSDDDYGKKVPAIVGIEWLSRYHSELEKGFFEWTRLQALAKNTMRTSATATFIPSEGYGAVQYRPRITATEQSSLINMWTNWCDTHQISTTERQRLLHDEVGAVISQRARPYLT